jgi:hypothetical protein
VSIPTHKKREVKQEVSTLQGKSTQEVTDRILSMVAEKRQTSFHHLRNFGCQLKTRETADVALVVMKSTLLVPSQLTQRCTWKLKQVKFHGQNSQFPATTLQSTGIVSPGRTQIMLPLDETIH